MRKLVFGFLSTAVTALVFVGLLCAPAGAWSNSNTYNYNSTNRLQANIWLGNGQSFNWTSSSKYFQDIPFKTPHPSSITNKVYIKVNGFGVSLGNASGGTNGDKDYESSWTNTNNWISDLAGVNRVSNLFYANMLGSSTATAVVPAFGSTRSAVATTTKWS